MSNWILLTVTEKDNSPKIKCWSSWTLNEALSLSSNLTACPWNTLPEATGLLLGISKYACPPQADATLWHNGFGDHIYAKLQSLWLVNIYRLRGFEELATDLIECILFSIPRLTTWDQFRCTIKKCAAVRNTLKIVNGFCKRRSHGMSNYKTIFFASFIQGGQVVF